MKQLSKDQKRYVFLNLLFLCGLLFYLFYRYLIVHYEVPMAHCFLREWFGVYCPFCGGTRCVHELFHLHFLSALRYNAYVVLLTVLFLLWEIVTLIRFLRGKNPFFTIPKWIFTILTVLLILFFIFRTILYFGYGIDWLGDLK